MKSKRYIYSIIAFLFLSSISFSQSKKDDDKSSWFKDNVSIRKTFDGSKNEKKPAAFTLFENHKSDNDYFSADIAIKFIEWELFGNSNQILTLFPVIEYHKSSNEEDEKDKLSVGLNGEYYFGENLTLKPYLLSNFVFKRNLLENKNELKYTAQFSFFSLKKGFPGATWRFNDKESNYRGTYYPYLGFEYNEIPNLLVDGTTEHLSNLFVRLFVDFWFLPQTVQVIFNGTYRNLLSEENIKDDLPLLNLSLNYYPGKQENISIGVDYKNGYDPEAKYNLVETTSLNLKVNF